MGVLLYGVFLAHVYSYREEYMNIGITFATTVILRKLVKSIGSTDNSDLIGLGGGALTVGECAKLLNELTSKGFAGIPKDSSGTGEPFFGILELIKSSLGK